MNLDDLTLGQIKQLKSLLGTPEDSGAGLCDQIGKKVIVRTFSAGVFFGTLHKKHGAEVILKNARRMWRWHSKESITLSGVAKSGIDQEKSQLPQAVDEIWLQPIEIISVSEAAAPTIEGAPIAKKE